MEETKKAEEAKGGNRAMGIPEAHSGKLRELSEWLAEEGYQGMVLLSRDYMDEDAPRVCAYVSGTSDALAECMLSPLDFMEDGIDKLKYSLALGKALEAVAYNLMRAGEDDDECASPAPMEPEP